MTDNTQPEALIDLIDAYAETRHRYGRIHNARTEAARNAVIEALSGVQALSAAPAVPAGWKAVPVNPTPEMWKAAKTVPDPNPPYPPHYGLVWDAMLAASPTPPAEQQAAPKAAPGDAIDEAMRERDDAEDFIDALLDEVLGHERPEWSNLYGRADALNDVQERMTSLHKPAVDKAWGQFQSAMSAPQPAPAPLSDDVVKDAARYRFLAGHCRSTSEHWGGRWSIVVDGPAPKSHDSEDDFDEAVDAALAAQEGK